MIHFAILFISNSELISILQEKHKFFENKRTSKYVVRSLKNCGLPRIKISTIEVSFVDECFQIPTIEKFNGTVTMIRRIYRITHIMISIMLAICAMISDRQNFPKGRRVDSEWKNSKYFFCKCFDRRRQVSSFLPLPPVSFVFLWILYRIMFYLFTSKPSIA